MKNNAASFLSLVLIWWHLEKGKASGRAAGDLKNKRLEHINELCADRPVEWERMNALFFFAQSNYCDYCGVSKCASGARCCARAILRNGVHILTNTGSVLKFKF